MKEPDGMPDRSSRLTLARQWQLLRQLPSRPPGGTARQLTKALADNGFPASKRTIERDLAVLERVFPIRCNDKGRPYGWYWMRDADLGIPGVDLAEALSLTMVERFLRCMLPLSFWRAFEPRLVHASEKLRALTDRHRAARWPEKIRYVSPSLPLIPPSIDPSVLDRVQQALLQDRQLDVTYRSADDDGTRPLTLHPLGMIQRGLVAYVVATASDYTDVRFFAVHRMQAAEIRAEPVSRPDGFSLDAYLDAGGGHFVDPDSPGQVRLEARVTDELARILEETPLSQEQTLETNSDRHHVSARVADTWQLRWWILSQGSRIEVLQPDGLRHEIMDEVRGLHETYNGS